MFLLFHILYDVKLRSLYPIQYINGYNYSLAVLDHAAESAFALIWFVQKAFSRYSSSKCPLHL